MVRGAGGEVVGVGLLDRHGQAARAGGRVDQDQRIAALADVVDDVYDSLVGKYI